MEGLREFLEKVRQQHLVRGNLRALFHVCIGRKISKADGTLLSNGVTWRELSDLLRTIRWDKELVRELGLNPDDLPPRDRLRYWYAAILAAQITSTEVRELGDEFARRLVPLGFVIASAPGS